MSFDCINWEQVQRDYERVKKDLEIKQLDSFYGNVKVSVYAIPTTNNPKNIIRIDIK